MRLAGNLSIFESIEPGEVKSVHIQQAITLVEYYLSETLRVRGCIQVHPDISLANELLKWFRKKNITAISIVEIYQYGSTKIRTAAKARLLMKILVLATVIK
ncbi:unknown protein [Waddlia chondrophila 2032/99]|uniref:Uncharacterized protein n=1 Tax=Waddlia chondrophila 2032/99 TaxID=765953 RepID=F8LCS4_9BACT|nr:unknown protein [Waddlia chondrophila 2032/99]